MPSAAPTTSASTTSQRIIATGVVLGFLYVAGSLVMTVIVSMLLASTLDPVVRLFTRRGVPRSLGSLLTVGMLLAGTYLLFYMFFAQGQAFVADFPKYYGTLRDHVLRVKKKAEVFQRTTKDVISPREVEGPELPPPPESQKESPITSALVGVGQTLTEALLMLSFVPFLVYFFLAWKVHIRRNTILMVQAENRVAAERMIDGITQMIYGFVLGNVMIGLMLSAASFLLFWAFGLPYAFFLGPMSGFLSLVPYFGVVLAVVPPFLAGLVQFNTLPPLVGIVGGVILLHLIALNVLYPKIVGRRVHLNPVVVTLAIMFWGWLWGGMGLLLAVPITAAIKAVCDNVHALRAYGRLLGD
jgi:predicted PurR-regulated permease PerM